MQESGQSFVPHPILTIVRDSLGEVLDSVRMPPLPALSPIKLQSLGAPGDITNDHAYIANSLAVAVWAQCMIGLDFMEGLRSTIASPTHFSAHVQARAAIESFAFAFWICDDRLTLNERYVRALLVNRASVDQERRRYLRGCQKTPLNPSPSRIHAFDARLELIDMGVASFTEQLDRDGIDYPARLPKISQVVENILADVSPIPEQLYGSLSAVVHGDSIFTWGLLSPHPDGIQHPESDDHVALASTITNHLTPAVHAVMAMCISVGVGSLTLDIDCEVDAMAALAKDLQAFIAHNGNDPTWFRAGDSASEARLQSLAWYTGPRR